MTENAGMSARISKKAFLNSFFILLGLMIISGILTMLVPTGAYERTMTDGRQVIVSGSFKFIDAASLPIYKWLGAPIAVLFGPDGASVIVIIMFIIFIGGTFAVLDKCGLLKYVITKIVHKYKNNKYALLQILILSFMLFGSVFGIFEETIALVPVCIALAYSFGWDAFVGLSFSILATGFGFASATFNPFTVGIAQKMAELPAFSGVIYRAVIFVAIYAVFNVIIVKYAKKIENDPTKSSIYEEEKELRLKYAGAFDTDGIADNPSLNKSVKIFLCFMAFLAVFIVAGFFVPFLSSVSLPIIAVIFLIAGIVSGAASNYGGKLAKDLLGGMAAISPSIILILMAVSVKYIITEGKVMDTLLYYAQTTISSTNPYAVIVLIYAFVMLLNFFIGSGSAKALLVIPIITGLADLAEVTRQTTVLAFCFGDGFSNMLYPTNPVLMIALSLTVISYTKWLRWVFKLQAIVFLMSLAFLFIGVLMQYGPF